MQVRPSVRRFAERMERVLRRHDSTKGGQDKWITEDSDTLLKRLREETLELVLALVNLDGNMIDKESVMDEAADVANFAMMIADQLDDEVDDGLWAERIAAGWIPAKDNEQEDEQ